MSTPPPPPGRATRVALWPVLLVAARLASTPAPAQSVRIDRILSGALRPGVTNLIVLAGENLAPGQTLVLGPGQPSRPGRARPDGIGFPLPLPADSPAGIVTARVHGTNGISAPLLLAVDPLPTLAQYPTATNVPLARLPAALEGVNPGGTTNHFHFTLRRDETIGLEILARRRGSTLDPWVSILGPDGHAALVCEDSPGLQGDVAVAFTARRTGAHEIVLRDSDFDGGSAAGFRLRIARLPRGSRENRVGSSRTGSWGEAARVGQGVAELVPLGLLEAPGQVPGTPSGEGYPRVAWPAGTSPTLPIRVPIPSRIRGVLPENGRRLVVEFSVDRPRSLRAVFRSRDLGSLGDVAALLEDAGGRLLAELDATRSDDGTLVHDFTQPGRHRLVLRELSGAGGAAYPFECQLGPGGGEVSLSVETTSAELPPGGRIHLPVQATRRGHDGPVELRVAGLPPGWPEARATLAPKAREASVELQIPPDAVPGNSLVLALLGEFSTPDEVRVVRASTRGALRKLWPDLLTLPPSLDGAITVGVTHPPVPPATPSPAAAGVQAGLRP